MNIDLNAQTETENPSEQPSTLPVEYIQNLVDNYRNNQLSVINDTMNMIDSHSIQFDLPTLKKFISDIENLAETENPEITDADLGIRFYYAAYPETPESSVPEDYALRHTLVLIPTINKEIEGEIFNCDFNPLENDEENKKTALMPTRALNALAQNHGSLAPPSSYCVESY